MRVTYGAVEMVDLTNNKPESSKGEICSTDLTLFWLWTLLLTFTAISNDMYNLKLVSKLYRHLLQET